MLCLSLVITYILPALSFPTLTETCRRVYSAVLLFCVVLLVLRRYAVISRRQSVARKFDLDVYATPPTADMYRTDIDRDTTTAIYSGTNRSHTFSDRDNRHNQSSQLELKEDPRQSRTCIRCRYTTTLDSNNT